MPIRKVFVTPWRLRRWFNADKLYERALNGDFRIVVRADRVPHPPPPGHPPGTRSQTVAYVNEHGAWVALVHQYVLPDGRLGGSGKPDPKYLRRGNTIFLPKSTSEGAGDAMRRVRRGPKPSRRR